MVNSRIIVYSSNTGYTRQYAKLLGKALDMPSYELSSVPEFHAGAEAVYLGWLFAGSIVGYKKCAKKYNVVCAVGVGMSPPSPELAEGLRAAMKIPEGVPVFVSAGIEQDFKITPAQLEAAITPKTKALILCSPSNPTGSVYSKDELAALAEVLNKHPQVTVVADEIYEHINYVGKHESIAQFPGMKERTVIVNGVSKAYAMTGWRIGFIAGPEWIVKACNKLQGQYTSGPCSVSQKAAEAAYTGTQAPVEEMRKAFERRRDLIVRLAKEVPGLEVNVPQGAFYLFPRCSSFFGKSDGKRTIETSDDLAMYLLEEAHVACVGGTSFGAPDCIRMSYATSDENIAEAIRRIKDALAKLK